MATPLIHWIASFLWPYRIRVVGILLLSVTEIALLAAAPWTLKLIVDQVLGSVEFPATLTAVLPILDNLQPITLLLIFAVSGLLLQMGSEAARMQRNMRAAVVTHQLRQPLLDAGLGVSLLVVRRVACHLVLVTAAPPVVALHRLSHPWAAPSRCQPREALANVATAL